jgi:Cobyrinic acid a,c-diamide synthase
MYLMDELEYVQEPQKDGCFEMCGVLSGSARMVKRRVVNFVVGEFQKDCILGKKGNRFKGHEFHHSEILLRAHADFAYKILRGVGIKDGMDGIITKNCLASFAHLHAASYTGFAENFVRSARQRI